MDVVSLEPSGHRRRSHRLSNAPEGVKSGKLYVLPTASNECQPCPDLDQETFTAVAYENKVWLASAYCLSETKENLLTRGKTTFIGIKDSV